MPHFLRDRRHGENFFLIEEREKEKPLRARVKKIETQIATLDKELATLEGKLADPKVYDGPTVELMNLSQRQSSLRGEKEALELEWLGILEQIGD